MDFEQSQPGQPDRTRVELEKSVPLFAVAGGLLTVLELAVSPLPIQAVAHLMGFVLWALAGALYAWLSNRRANDVSQSRYQLKTGAIAGAIVAFIASSLVGLCVMPVLLAMGAASLFLTWGPALLAAVTGAGAFTGAVCGALVGRFCLDTHP